MSSYLTVFKGNLSPSVSDTIKVDRVAFDLTGSSVRFRMRLQTSSTLKVDASASIVLASAGTVRYDWQAADVDTPGSYRAWWSVTLQSGKVQDTPEFDVEVRDHAPTPSTKLCGLVQVREYLQKTGGPSAIDEAIESLISRVSTSIETYCGREFADRGSLTRRLPVTRHNVPVREPWDLRSVSAMSLHPESSSPVALVADASSSGYSLRPLGGGTLTGTYDEILLSRDVDLFSDYRTAWGVALLDVTGSWGLATVPNDVQDAAVVAVATRLRREVLAGTQSVPSDSGSPLVPMPLPNTVKAMLDPFRRWPA